MLFYQYNWNTKNANDADFRKYFFKKTVYSAISVKINIDMAEYKIINSDKFFYSHLLLIIQKQ